MKYNIPIFLMFLVSSVGLAQVSLPPNGISIVGSSQFRDAGFWSQADVASRLWIEDGGPVGEGAWRFTITRNPGDFWGAELQMANNRSLATDGVVLMRFFARAIGTDPDSSAWCHLYAQYPPPSGNYEKDIVAPLVLAGSDWHEIFMPFALSRDSNAGQLQVVFGLGADPAQLEIANFEAIYWADGVDLDDLPRSSVRYPWMLANAPWRAEANARIEQYRKADLQIELTDASGQPVQGATIEIRQLTHAFQFGTALAFWRLLTESPDNAIYREKFLELFNAGGNENALKAPAWQGDWGTSRYGREVALDGLRWLNDRDIPARGHVLVWPGIDNLPDSQSSLLDTPDQSQIPGMVLAHIEDIMSATSGMVAEWDVLNEPYTNHELMDRFGDRIMADWFNKAAEEAPQGTRLFVNDYSILSGGGNATKETYHLNQLDEWLADGLPVHGFGFQSHFTGLLTEPSRVYEILDRFASRGLQLRITEFDIDSPDFELQAEYLRDFYTIAFSHPSVIGIQMWGFWAGSHWKPNAAMFASDWTARPTAEAYQSLVWGDWFTRTNAVTDDNGRASVRGFHGDYEIMIKMPTRSITTRLSLPPEGATVPISIPAPSEPPPQGSLKLRLNDGRFILDWLSEPASTYRLYSSSDLQNWFAMSDPLGSESIALSQYILDPSTRESSTMANFFQLQISPAATVLPNP